MKKKIAVLLTMSVLSLGCRISALTFFKFVNTIPENGSEISTFDIKYQFDISESIIELGVDNLAVGCSGYYSEEYQDDFYCSRLFEGTPEDGRLLAVALGSNFTGSAESRDIIDLDFLSSIVPEEGKTYTIVCSNAFPLFNLNTGKIVGWDENNWQREPASFTFIGKKASSSELVLQSTSLTENQDMESLSSIDFEFNEDIAIAQDNLVQIFDGEEPVASSKSIEIDTANPKALKATFDEVILYLGKQYTIKLPEGTACLKNNPAALNKPIEIKVKGASTIRVSIKSASPENNSTILPDKAEIKFNLPEETTLAMPGDGDPDDRIDIYKGEITEENFITTLWGPITSDGHGISWDLSAFRFEPETKYTLHKKAGDIRVWKKDGPELLMYRNEEVIISFTTVSIEESGFPPMEFSTPEVALTAGSYSEYAENMECGYLSSFRLTLNKDKHYYTGVKKGNLHVHPDFADIEACNLYEVTPSGDKLIKSFGFSQSRQEDDRNTWLSAESHMSVFLYESKQYKFVIPEGYFTAYPDLLCNVMPPDLSKVDYVKSEAMVFTFTGTMPSEAVLLDCNVADNSEASVLYNILWTFDGRYTFAGENHNISYKQIKEGNTTGIPPLTGTYEATLSQSPFNTTYLMADFVNRQTGLPLELRKDEVYTFTLPKGIIVNEINDEITNEEYTVTVRYADESEEPQTVNVNLKVKDLLSSTQPALKDTDFQFTLRPNVNWEVESVLQDKTPVTPVQTGSNTYQVPILQEDTTITAILKYAGPWAVEETTGIWTIENTGIRIYRENDKIVVDGVTPANTINVYSVGGMLINTTHVSDGMDKASISVALGQIYIVTVDGTAAKINME